MREFTYLRPFPFEPLPFINTNREGKLGPMSLAQAVKFFWRLQTFTVQYNLMSYVEYQIDNQDPIIEYETSNSGVCNLFANSTAFKEPYLRGKEPVIEFASAVSEEAASVSISLPHYAQIYDKNMPLQFKQFYYYLDPSLSFGAIDIGIDNQESDLTKIFQRIDFMAMGFTGHFYASTQRAFLEEPDYKSSFSCNINLNFGFY